MLIGLPPNFAPYRPSPRGGGASAIGMIRRAAAAWRSSRPAESAVAPATAPVRPPRTCPASLTRRQSSAVIWMLLTVSLAIAPTIPSNISWVFEANAGLRHAIMARSSHAGVTETDRGEQHGENPETSGSVLGAQP